MFLTSSFIDQAIALIDPSPHSVVVHFGFPDLFSLHAIAVRASFQYLELFLPG